jgi:hypothetical protein
MWSWVVAAIAGTTQVRITIYAAMVREKNLRCKKIFFITPPFYHRRFPQGLALDFLAKEFISLISSNRTTSEKSHVQAILIIVPLAITPCAKSTIIPRVFYRYQKRVNG